MTDILLPFLSYVFVTTFTPGPNNITSASAGMEYGYAGSLRYLFGIFTGFVLIMFVCGFLTETVVRILPKLAIVLRIAGSVYMIWLAVTILRSIGKQAGEKGRFKATFGRGVFLQLVNPKVIIYGITVFSGFLLPRVGSIMELVLASMFLAGVAFASISLWSLFGTAFKHYLDRGPVRLVFNICMAGLLLYSAISIAGVC
jgi:cysteine/O-acetylserine efflux protein